MMKETEYLINVAGGIVSEAALCTALKSNTIAGAAIRRQQTAEFEKCRVQFALGHPDKGSEIRNVSVCCLGSH